MSNIRFTSMLGLCAMLAACSDSPTRPSISASDLAPSFDAANPPDGKLVDVGTDEVIEPNVGAEQAATGGKASGHADITRKLISVTVGDRYSFTALSTEPSKTTPFAAKGEFQGRIELVFPTTTSTRTIHADVDCLRITGNIAIISGPVEKFRIDGQSVNFAPGLQVFIQVQDNGEGAKALSPDAASPIFTTPVRQACQLFIVGTIPDEKNNIQVKPN